MKPRILPSERSEWQSLGACWALSLTITFLALSAPTPSQEPPQPAQSIADAARNARAQNSNSTASPRVFTNDDLSVAPSPASETPISKESHQSRPKRQHHRRRAAILLTTTDSRQSCRPLRMNWTRFAESSPTIPRRFWRQCRFDEFQTRRLRACLWVATAAANPTAVPYARKRSHSRRED